MRKISSLARKEHGARLRQLREQAGLSQDELAQIAGVGQPGRRNGPSIGAWERTGGAQLEAAVKVCEALARVLGRAKAEILAYVVWG